MIALVQTLHTSSLDPNSRVHIVLLSHSIKKLKHKLCLAHASEAADSNFGELIVGKELFLDVCELGFATGEANVSLEWNDPRVGSRVLPIGLFV
jgi:hypothetical protein